MDYGFAMRFLTPPKTAFLLGVDRRACLQWQTESRPSSESSFSKDIALGFSGKLGFSSREGSWTLRCFFGTGPSCGYSFRFLLVGFELGDFLSQDCELTHVQSSSKNTFKKKGWVKLSVCQNFAVRNARGCGSVDKIRPPLWPLVLPWVMASGIASSMSTVHAMCPWFRSLPFSWRVSKTVREANLASNRRSHCSPGRLRRLHLPTQRKSSWLGFVDFADDSVVDHSTFDSSQCASRMVKDHQKGSSFVVHREDGMVQGFKDEEGPTLRIGRTNRFPGWSQFLPTSTGCTQFLCASMPCGSHHIKTYKNTSHSLFSAIILRMRLTAWHKVDARGAVGGCFAAMVFASPRWCPMSRHGHAASTGFALVLEAARLLEISANDL